MPLDLGTSMEAKSAANHKPPTPKFHSNSPWSPRSRFGINPELILSKIPFSRLNLGVVYAGICGDSSPSPQTLLGSIWACAGTGGPHGAFPVGAVSFSASNFPFFHEFIPLPHPPAPSAAAAPDTSVHIWAGLCRLARIQLGAFHLLDWGSFSPIPWIRPLRARHRAWKAPCEALTGPSFIKAPTFPAPGADIPGNGAAKKPAAAAACSRSHQGGLPFPILPQSPPRVL